MRLTRRRSRRCGPATFGPAVQWAIEHQIKVGAYLGARGLRAGRRRPTSWPTPSCSASAGVEWLERWARLPADERRVRIPTITDPRGTDFAAAHKLKQQPWMLDLERRAIAAFEALGVLMTDTCINYQTIMPPVRGEHCAYGDTGVVIYSNSVCGARSNFEGGPSALSAGLTGPHAALWLSSRRAARRRRLSCRPAYTPRELNEWGALGGIVGRLAGDYWQVPGAGRARPHARLRRDEAFRRRARRATARWRCSTWSASRRRRSGSTTWCRSGELRTPRRRRGRHSRIPGRAMRRRSTASIWWCSRRRN